MDCADENVGAGVTTIVNVLPAAVPDESNTWAVKDEVVPLTVPVIRPVKSMLNPAGSAPELTDHVYVPVPPVADRVCA